MTVVESLVHDIMRIPNREDIEGVWLDGELYESALAECNMTPAEFELPIVDRRYHIRKVPVRRLGER